MPRKSVSGFAEAGAAMAQQLDDNDLLNLFSAVGRVVSKRFLMKRHASTGGNSSSTISRRRWRSSRASSSAFSTSTSATT
jgi:hypothetical protein